MSAGAHIFLKTPQNTLNVSLIVVALTAATLLKLKGTVVERPLHHKM